MFSQMWIGRASIFLCLLYSAILAAVPQSIEFYRSILLRGDSLPIVFLNLAWPNLLASIAFVLSAGISNLGAATSRDSSTTLTRYPTLLAFALAALPFIATTMGVADASRRLGAEAEDIARTLVPILAVSGVVLGLVACLVAYFVSSRDSASWRWTIGLLSISAGALIVFLVLTTGPLHLSPSELVNESQRVGPLGILALFFGLLAIVLSGVVRATRGTWIPGLTLLVLVAVGLGLAGFNNNHQIRAHEAQVEDALKVLDVSELERWVVDRKESNGDVGLIRPLPVFVVAAQGGGIYAAYHTAIVLAWLQEAWPEFPRHVISISSVSGGSLGSSLYIALLSAMDGKPKKDCNGRTVGPREIVDRFFENDFLSPVLYMALFPDFAQRLWPRPVTAFDRALGLEYAIEDAWDRLAAECNWTVANPFKKGIREFAWRANKNWPVLFINTTHEQSGQLVAISNVRNTKAVTSIWEMGLKRDLNLSTAAVLSARFPYITPFGWFEGKQLDWFATFQPVRVFLGDGGYYDNSGADVLTDFSLILKNLAVRTNIDIDVYSIVIGDVGFARDNFIASLRDQDRPLQVSMTVPQTIRSRLREFRRLYDEEEEPIGSTVLLGELWSPFRAVMRGRVSRSKESILSLLRVSSLYPWQYGERPPQIPKYTIFSEYGFVFPLDTRNMPLGWLLSKYTRDKLAVLAGGQDECVVGKYPDTTRLRVIDKLGEFISKYSKYRGGLGSAIDIYVAACSIEKISELGRQ